ncbi:MAG: aldehyde dehydrogenase family protein [Bacteroidia bacterium]|nr:aldehyde dehydrogenase family protein [Bacteroidia bacterium]
MQFDTLIKANRDRKFFANYNENPKAYDENLNASGLLAFQNRLNSNYILPSAVSSSDFYGEEISPYLQTGLGIHYPKLDANSIINNAVQAFDQWRKLSPNQRYDILFDSLEQVSKRFFELAYATMHTTGQSFLMSFQASGPHACDRALEVMVTGIEQLSYFPNQVDWVKNMGKFDLSIHKNYKPIPKGVGLVIGCSTFPTWNTVPGVYANLITGNSVVIKPHPKAVYPIAIFVEELQNVLIKNNLSPNIVQLAIDSSAEPITKVFAEHDAIKLIDYTGGNNFGDYIESLGKTCFTEKAGINSIIVDSCSNFNAAAQNIAFSFSLYSGQMCTAPQNIYIPASGVSTPDGIVSFDEAVQGITAALKGLMENPKAAAPTLGAIQNDGTIARIQDKINQHQAQTIQLDVKVENAEFNTARLKVPSIIVTDAADSKTYLQECFGPLVFIVKTSNFDESLKIVKDSARNHGAITCLAYSTDKDKMALIEDEMNSVFTPVSFNFTGAAFVNQHAAFSDLHVSGGNPSGNASFTNADFINKRYIWIGNRYML